MWTARDEQAPFLLFATASSPRARGLSGRPVTSQPSSCVAQQHTRHVRAAYVDGPAPASTVLAFRNSLFATVARLAPQREIHQPEIHGSYISRKVSCRADSYVRSDF